MRTCAACMLTRLGTVRHMGISKSRYRFLSIDLKNIRVDEQPRPSQPPNLVIIYSTTANLACVIWRADITPSAHVEVQG